MKNSITDSFYEALARKSLFSNADFQENEGSVTTLR